MTTDPRYQSTIARLSELYVQKLVPSATAGLRRVHMLLDYLDHPEQRFRSIHVAGSSGKGSTTTMIGSVLQCSGLRTGYFRSPHLHSYRERIAVQGLDISEKDWCACFDRVWPMVESMRDGIPAGYDLGRPSFFEVLFAMMCVHFADSGVEWAAVEAGLGGRLDATNVLQPEVAVITNISLEHTQVLGSEISTIAAEKAAIMKPGAHAVTATRDSGALDVLRARAAEMAIPLRVVGSDVRFEIVTSDLHGQTLLLTGNGHKVVVSLQLAGNVQAWNAGAAYATILGLRERGVDIGDNAFVEGLLTARFPGRFEIVSWNPLIVLDGAHHPAAMQHLVETLQRLIPEREVVFLFGAMADKDIGAMAREIGKVARSVILTEVPDSPRTAGIETLHEAFLPHVSDVLVSKNVESALEVAQRTSDDAALVVTGSLYLVGYAKMALAEKVVAC